MFRPKLKFNLDQEHSGGFWSLWRDLQKILDLVNVLQNNKYRIQGGQIKALFVGIDWELRSQW